MTEPSDWIRWHEAYSDPTSSLAQRLDIVIGHIGAALESIDRSPVRVISMCAGEARDLRGALEQVQRRDLVGRLVELDPILAENARGGLHALAATDLEVVVGDAGVLQAYAGAAPADLVLECGVFGNIPDTDVERTIRASTALCAPGATLIWTRHRRPPDLTASIHRWLEESGFENVAFDAISHPQRKAAVGVARFRGETTPLTEKRLFSFE